MFLEEVPGIKKEIRNYLEGVVLRGKNSGVIDAARYVVLNENAQFSRPLLTVAAARDYGVSDLDRVMFVASAVELVHAASLISDDVADTANKRRGKDSCHIAFKPEIADLAKLYLINRAYGLIGDRKLSSMLTDKQRVDIIRIASESGDAMVRGQFKDITQKMIDDVSGIKRMYEQKSGALFALALACGGIVGNANPDDVTKLRQIGLAIGVCYQIADDVLDLSPQFSSGKPTGQDVKKKTLSHLLGKESAKQVKIFEELEVHKALPKLNVHPTCMGEFISFLMGEMDSKFTTNP